MHSRLGRANAMWMWFSEFHTNFACVPVIGVQLFKILDSPLLSPNIMCGPLQTYKAKHEEGKRTYEEKVSEFMQGLGGMEEQEAYLESLAEYRTKRRAYLKNFRLKKLGLLKVCLLL